MSKMLSSAKKLLLILGVLLLICGLFVAVFIWYEFFDVTGLTLYSDEPISDIIPYKGRVYFITEDGYGYVAGDYNSNSRLYRNSEFHPNEKLGIPSPVKFSDEKIKLLLPFTKGALFITENNELYKLKDISSEIVCNNIVYADKAAESIYAIDIVGDLYSIDEQNQKTFLSSNIKQVKAYRNRIFVLLEDGSLCELTKSENSDCVISDPIFEGVKEFDVLDTSVRFDGEKFIYDDQEAINTPLFNVLTNENELYIKGFYNLLCCTRLASAFPSPAQFEDWTLISEDVSEFAMAPMGTVFKQNDSSCAYYGFDTDMRGGTVFEVGYKNLLRDGCVGVKTSNDICIYVKAENNKYYMWGDWSTLLFDQHSSNHHIFSGEPFVLEP